MSIPLHIPERLENILDRIELDCLTCIQRRIREDLPDAPIFPQRRFATDRAYRD